MSRMTRRGAILGVGAFGLVACAKRRIAEAPREEPRGGIGGTGIVGQLTDFGSLIVAGKRVELPGDAELRNTLGRIASADLALGQTLSLEASTAADGALTARRVLVADPLVGRVETAADDGRSFQLLGVRATLDPGAGPPPRIGDRVAVSGVWRGAEVSASRVAIAAPGADAIAGAVRFVDGAPHIGGARREMDAEPTPGAFAVARGRFLDGALRVDAFEEGRFVGAGGPLTRLAVEGYLDPVAEAPFYVVSGLGHSFDAAARLAPFQTRRTLFEGPYAGTFAVETGLPLPEDANARRDLLRRALTGALPPEARIDAR